MLGMRDLFGSVVLDIWDVSKDGFSWRSVKSRDSCILSYELVGHKIRQWQQEKYNDNETNRMFICLGL